MPLYLEWAPEDVFTQAAPVQEAAEEEPEAVDEDSRGYLFAPELLKASKSEAFMLRGEELELRDQRGGFKAGLPEVQGLPFCHDHAQEAGGEEGQAGGLSMMHGTHGSFKYHERELRAP